MMTDLPVVFLLPSTFLCSFSLTLQKKKQEEEERANMWLRGEGGRSTLTISSPLEATMASKANGVYDVRGYGDGHSFSGGYTDAYGSPLAGEEGRGATANTTFQGMDAGGQRTLSVAAAPSSAAATPGRTYHNEDQTETHF